MGGEIINEQVLELGIVVHSVIIGISLGTSGSTSTVKTLMAALTFHQFFEGMGLGGCITQVNKVISFHSLGPHEFLNCHDNVARF